MAQTVKLQGQQPSARLRVGATTSQRGRVRLHTSKARICQQTPKAAEEVIQTYSGERDGRVGELQ